MQIRIQCKIENGLEETLSHLAFLSHFGEGIQGHSLVGMMSLVATAFTDTRAAPASMLDKLLAFYRQLCRPDTQPRHVLPHLHNLDLNQEFLRVPVYFPCTGFGRVEGGVQRDDVFGCLVIVDSTSKESSASEFVVFNTVVEIVLHLH